MRALLLIACCLAALSCRDVQPVNALPEPIDGYLLRGSVTTVGGIALDSVEVRMWFNYDPADTGPIDTSHVVVTDPTKIVDVSVTTPEGAFVRQLYLSYRPPGVVPRFQWDFFDANGAYVPSGEYVVRYAFDTMVVKRERRIIEGTPTVFTDAGGRFEIGADRFPVGKTFDIYTVQNQYAGTYVVLPKIDLEFRKGGLFGASSVTLQLNQITNAAFTVR